MTAMASTRWHTYRSAAKRVGRSERTIRYWRQWGMPMEWQVIDGQRTRVVREDILLRHFRQHLAKSPVHQYRMRAQRRTLPDAA
jgi:hypothetical protein